MYRSQRDYENLQKAMFEGVGEYRIPAIQPVYDCEVDNWISFNFVRGCENPEEHAVNFFIDDYQFVRCWKNPDAYVQRLAQFQAVCSPDFSPYADFPKAVQVFNHYRKHWLGAYWQMHGVKVIPTITWSDPSTLEWCFDGEPTRSVVALSSVGMFRTQEYRDWFFAGYEEMMWRLQPTKIFWKGHIPDEVDEDRNIIVPIPSFTDKWRDD